MQSQDTSIRPGMFIFSAGGGPRSTNQPRHPQAPRVYRLPQQQVPTTHLPGHMKVSSSSYGLHVHHQRIPASVRGSAKRAAAGNGDGKGNGSKNKAAPATVANGGLAFNGTQNSRPAAFQPQASHRLPGKD